MRAFSGSEPLVGEVFGLRTFRVDESGLLLPLYSDLAWYDGPNHATCVPPTGEPERSDHQIAAPGCECGFYAFGDAVAAGHNRHSRYVLAVVGCWGSVVAGTQGVRAERARIDAIWLGEAAPPWLRKRVALTYPSARVYADKAAMLAEHPLTSLPCYRPAKRLSVPARTAALVVGVGLAAVGMAPTSLARGTLWDLWVALTAVLAVVAVWLGLGARTTGHTAAAVVVAGCVAWVAAPLFGILGWLLRLPVLRAVCVVLAGYLVGLRPGYFPIERGPVPDRFRGVVA